MPDEQPPVQDLSPPLEDEQRANISGRVRQSVRRRARVYAATHDVALQDVLDEALDEYLRRRGG